MPQTYKVWFLTEPPKPSWTAYRHRSTGELTIFDDHAEFRAKNRESVVLSNVRRVAKGWKNQEQGLPMLPVVDTYIEVVYGTEDDPSIAFINDGRWFGFATYLPHRRLVASLRSLIGKAAPPGRDQPD